MQLVKFFLFVLPGRASCQAPDLYTIFFYPFISRRRAASLDYQYIRLRRVKVFYFIGELQKVKKEPPNRAVPYRGLLGSFLGKLLGLNLRLFLGFRGLYGDGVEVLVVSVFGIERNGSLRVFVGLRSKRDSAVSLLAVNFDGDSELEVAYLDSVLENGGVAKFVKDGRFDGKVLLSSSHSSHF